MSADKFWAELEAGAAVKVNIPAAARRKPSRQRIVRVSKWAHYEGFDPRDGRGRPRCRAEGCSKDLRRHQPLACSPECEALVRDEFAALQDLIGRTP